MQTIPFLAPDQPLAVFGHRRIAVAVAFGWTIR
jgi:hypothetical protein